MSNTVRNEPCNAVTHDVRSLVRGCVQNQNQNQTVVTTAVSALVASQIQVQSVPREQAIGLGGQRR